MIDVGYPLFSASRISLQTEPNSLSLLKLSKDEVVEAKVVKSLGSDKALLLINGRNITAKTPVPLRQGGVLSLKVQEVFPLPTLKLLGIKLADQGALNIPAIFSAIKENLWKSTSEALPHYGLPRESLSVFKELMNEVSQRLFLEQSTELLREFIDKSGLSWEAKLRKAFLSKTMGGADLSKLLEGDLKGLASRLLALKGKKAVRLEQFVSTIRSIQLLNHLGLEQNRQIFLPIPMQFPQGLFSVGQLLIQLPQKGKDECRKQKKDRDYVRITFLLELSHLGPLRADLTIRGKEIQGVFLLTREKAKVLVEKSIPYFIRRIKERGFSVHFMVCQRKEPERVRQSLLREIIHDAENTINFVA